MSALFPTHYGNPDVRGRASLRLTTGEFLGDDAYFDHCSPGSTVTYKGRRYEIVRNLWFSSGVSTFPSAYEVKPYP